MVDRKNKRFHQYALVIGIVVVITLVKGYSVDISKAAFLFSGVSVISFVLACSFFPYYNTGLIAFLSGTAAGEVLWRRRRLPKLSGMNRQRYWNVYKDSIF